MKTKMSESGRVVKSAIKKLLKSQGRTQQELAKFMGLSLPTIKKQLNSEDFSFERLVLIAQFFNLKINEFIPFAFDSEISLSELTPEQDQLLSSHPRYIQILKSLFSAMSCEEIQERYSLSKTELSQYLSKMAESDLVSVFENGEVQLKILWPIKNSNPSSQLDDLFQAWTRKTLDRALIDSKTQPQVLNRFEFYCRKKSIEAFRNELAESLEKFKSVVAVDMKTASKEELDYYSVACVVGSFSGWDLFDSKK